MSDIKTIDSLSKNVSPLCKLVNSFSAFFIKSFILSHLLYMIINNVVYNHIYIKYKYINQIKELLIQI